MSEYTTLTSYLEALVAEGKVLENVDIDAIVEERLAAKRAEVKAEVIKDVDHAKVVNEAKIVAITDAIAITNRPFVANEIAEVDEVSEIISDETY